MPTEAWNHAHDGHPETPSPTAPLEVVEDLPNPEQPVGPEQAPEANALDRSTENAGASALVEAIEGLVAASSLVTPLDFAQDPDESPPPQEFQALRETMVGRAEVARELRAMVAKILEAAEVKIEGITVQDGDGPEAMAAVASLSASVAADLQEARHDLGVLAVHTGALSAYREPYVEAKRDHTFQKYGLTAPRDPDSRHYQVRATLQRDFGGPFATLKKKLNAKKAAALTTEAAALEEASSSDEDAVLSGAEHDEIKQLEHRYESLANTLHARLAEAAVRSCEALEAADGRPLAWDEMLGSRQGLEGLVRSFGRISQDEARTESMRGALASARITIGAVKDASLGADLEIRVRALEAGVREREGAAALAIASLDVEVWRDLVSDPGDLDPERLRQAEAFLAGKVAEAITSMSFGNAEKTTVLKTALAFPRADLAPLLLMGTYGSRYENELWPRRYPRQDGKELAAYLTGFPSDQLEALGDGKDAFERLRLAVASHPDDYHERRIKNPQIRAFQDKLFADPEFQELAAKHGIYLDESVVPMRLNDGSHEAYSTHKITPEYHYAYLPPVVYDAYLLKFGFPAELGNQEYDMRNPAEQAVEHALVDLAANYLEGSDSALQAFAVRFLERSLASCSAATAERLLASVFSLQDPKLKAGLAGRLADGFIDGDEGNIALPIYSHLDELDDSVTAKLSEKALSNLIEFSDHPMIPEALPGFAKALAIPEDEVARLADFVSAAKKCNAPHLHMHIRGSADDLGRFRELAQLPGAVAFMNEAAPLGYGFSEYDGDAFRVMLANGKAILGKLRTIRGLVPSFRYFPRGKGDLGLRPEESVDPYLDLYYLSKESLLTELLASTSDGPGIPEEFCEGINAAQRAWEGSRANTRDGLGKPFAGGPAALKGLLDAYLASMRVETKGSLGYYFLTNGWVVDHVFDHPESAPDVAKVARIFGLAGPDVETAPLWGAFKDLLVPRPDGSMPVGHLERYLQAVGSPDALPARAVLLSAPFLRAMTEDPDTAEMVAGLCATGRFVAPGRQAFLIKHIDDFAGTATDQGGFLAALERLDGLIASGGAYERVAAFLDAPEVVALLWKRPERLDDLLRLADEGTLEPHSPNLFFAENLEKILSVPEERRKDFMAVFSAINASPSHELQRIRNQLLDQILSTEDPVGAFAAVEDVFIRNNLPDVGKHFKVFSIIYPSQRVGEILGAKMKPLRGGEGGLSPFLTQATPRRRAATMYADLMGCHLRSGNPTLKNYLGILQEGQTYLDALEADEPLDEAAERQAEKVLGKLHTLFQNSQGATLRPLSAPITGAGIREAYQLLKEGLEVPEGQSITDRVADMYLRPVGVSDVASAMAVMREARLEAETRNLEAVRSGAVAALGEGDLIKAVDAVNMGSILRNGIVAREFLGANTGSDATPFDTDVSRLGSGSNAFSAVIADSASNGFGNTILILKDRGQFQLTTADTAEFEPGKYELFNSGVVASDHYGIRTGLPSTEIDAIVVRSIVSQSWQQLERLYFDVAQNGVYVPVLDEDGSLLLTPELFEEYRKPFRGISRFEGVQPQPLVLDGEMGEAYAATLAEAMGKARLDRESVAALSAEVRALVEAAFLQAGVGVKDVNDERTFFGGAEILDTGSTGRFTNLPGSYDFDLMAKLDNKDMANVEAVVASLVDALEAERVEQHARSGGGYQLRAFGCKAFAGGPLDVDVGFVSKSEHIAYASHDAIRDKLDGFHASGGEEAKEQAISAILLTKAALKRAGAYKKGEHAEGGLGGIGVETWILNEGGNMERAFRSFAEAAIDASGATVPLEEFKKQYRILDAGINLAFSKHDNYAGNLTESGYANMVAAIRSYFDNPQEFLEGLV